ncbi:MAG: 2-oxo acid dehydrogenase subunit E2 [Deltaproteobacteria bacterium]|nr:2-oxo acid dehydrogenase subunit E2 [Deltaproteobacteria bacterium]
MAFEFNLPDIGEGVTEGEIVSWLVQKGDTVTEDQPIVEVMTDKATVEIASPKNGVIAEIIGNEGETIEVGKPLAMINENGASTSATSTKDTVPSSPAPVEVTENVTPIATATKQSAATATAEHVLAAPITRKTAREMGVDINSLPGSGPLGRITMEDVKNAASGKINMPTTPTAKPQQPAAMSNTPALAIPTRAITSEKSETRIPVKGIRKKIVENMRKSLDHAAHFSHMDELDATNLVAARGRLKEKAAQYGVKLNYLPFVVKALVEALKLYPRLNASFDESSNEIVEKHYYNIGVAVATQSDDLVVPVIHNADQKGLLQIASEIKELADKAQTNKLTPGDFADGTFTVTSLGTFAGTYATPIINYPEMGILGFYKIAPRPVVRDGEIVARQMANISFSIDHRIVDGYLGAKFTKAFIEFLENPEMLLMF